MSHHSASKKKKKKKKPQNHQVAGTVQRPVSLDTRPEQTVQSHQDQVEYGGVIDYDSDFGQKQKVKGPSKIAARPKTTIENFTVNDENKSSQLADSQDQIQLLDFQGGMQ